MAIFFDIATDYFWVWDVAIVYLVEQSPTKPAKGINWQLDKYLSFVFDGKLQGELAR